jgi:flagellar biosynthesis GTPase FlhF
MAFGRMLRDLAGHTVHLVIPAEISSSDLRSSLEFFESFSPGKMLISHLDRPSSVGRVLEEVLSSQKPVSFVAAGSSPAGLLRAANPGLLSRLLLDAQDGLQEEAVENHEWSLK